ncbi:MAG TPA: acyl-CoA synthetase, partial [Usitatibacter sp.]|nr:acyl-CoA synthetase [Usitatibacter sp.]
MPFEPFPQWRWEIPEFLNIGVACTDAHLGSSAQERLAMVVEDDAHGTSSITYRELAERTTRFAELLRSMGVAAGDRVLIRLPNSIDYPTAFFGTLKRGAIAVPTSTLLTADEVRYLLQDSQAVAMVIDEAGLEAMGSRLRGAGLLRDVIIAGAPLMRALAAVPPAQPPERTRPQDPAYLVYTSGTTGYPKGVLHGHRSLVGRMPAAHYWFDFPLSPLGRGPGEGPVSPERVERIVHSGKFNWTYVLGSALMDPLFRGQTVIAHEGKNDAATWPRLITKHAATVLIGVPTIYRQILQKTSVGRADVPTLRHCMSAGEHLSDEVFAQWKTRFGLDIYEAVGMSECSYYLSQNKLRPIRPGSAGFPQPGHDVRLLDPETRAEVAQGEEGMIGIPESDPGLFLR